MRVITAGAAYLDIDAYAGIIAYAELLQKQGIEARAASTATPNESVPKLVREWPVNIASTYISSPEDTFTLIDISESQFFDPIVKLEQIDTIIDHHPGLEKYWHDKIGDNSIIEHVGAACTQVYEQWKKADMTDQISKTSARLLMCGILDNTLNFGATITSQRDHDAYNVLAKYADLPDDWPAQYFSACGESIEQDPVGAVKNDTKVMEFATYEQPVTIGQFAVWDAKSVAQNHQEELMAFFAGKNPWFINIISIGERKSYFLCEDPGLQHWLSRLLAIQFHGPLAVASRPWLRKEIMRQSILTSKSD
jgi:inorganic pyrophosphatase/exopolyphosphatase